MRHTDSLQGEVTDVVKSISGFVGAPLQISRFSVYAGKGYDSGAHQVPPEGQGHCAVHFRAKNIQSLVDSSYKKYSSV